MVVVDKSGRAAAVSRQKTWAWDRTVSIRASAIGSHHVTFLGLSSGLPPHIDRCAESIDAMAG